MKDTREVLEFPVNSTRYVSFRIGAWNPLSFSFGRLQNSSRYNNGDLRLTEEDEAVRIRYTPLLHFLKYSRGLGSWASPTSLRGPSLNVRPSCLPISQILLYITSTSSSTSISLFSMPSFPF